MLRPLSFAFVAASVLVMQPAMSQEARNVRGTIEALDGSTLTVKSRDGASVKIAVPADLTINVANKMSLTDIKPNSFIAIVGEAQDDGSQKAVSVVIFPEEARGRGEGSRGYDMGPKSTMTNATVAPDAVKSTDGQTVTVTYKGGEKKVLLTDKTLVSTRTPGTKDDLKVGASVMVSTAKKGEGLEASRLVVGKDGFVPL